MVESHLRSNLPPGAPSVPKTFKIKRFELSPSILNGVVDRPGGVGQVDWKGEEQNSEGRRAPIHLPKFILEQNLHFSSYQRVRQK